MNELINQLGICVEIDYRNFNDLKYIDWLKLNLSFNTYLWLIDVILTKSISPKSS